MLELQQPARNTQPNYLNKFTTLRLQLPLGRAGSFVAAAAATTATRAGRALVLLDVLGLGCRDLDALAMEPLLADVTADPELVRTVAFPTCAAECLPVLTLADTTATTFFLVGGWAFLCRGRVFCLHLGWRRRLWLLHLRL
jgi:hypothetical protein